MVPTPGSDTTGDSFQVSPHAFQPRAKVHQLSELNLQHRFMCLSVRGEDIQNHFAAVDNRLFHSLLEGSALRWREVVIEDHHLRFGRFDQLLQFFQFAGPQTMSRMRIFAELNDFADDIYARRFDQPLQFIKSGLFA